MSTFQPLAPSSRKKTIADLNPQKALRHEGNCADCCDRIQATLRLASSLGSEGLAKVGPYLPSYISDTSNLWAAWTSMDEHGGRSQGPDGRQLLDIPEDAIWPYLRAIKADLRSGHYRATEADEHICRIPKGPGRGDRLVTVQNQERRLAQRAALQVLTPLLDPKLDDHFFGGRLRRGPHMALATAERLFRETGRSVWVTEDLRDAFCCVPLPRLLQVVARIIPDKPTLRLLQGMLAGSRTSGLRQGGALSPLLLAVYLQHVLIRKWRARHPDIPLLLYVDDILLMCRSTKEAVAARQSLDELLHGTGMSLKGTAKNSVRPLIASRPAEWLGFRIRKQSRKLLIEIPESGIDRLADQFKKECETVSFVEVRCNQVLRAWLDYYGPCLVSEKQRESVFKRIGRMPLNHRLSDWLDYDEFNCLSGNAVDAWEMICDRVALRSGSTIGNGTMTPEWVVDSIDSTRQCLS